MVRLGLRSVALKEDLWLKPLFLLPDLRVLCRFSLKTSSGIGESLFNGPFVLRVNLCGSSLFILLGWRQSSSNFQESRVQPNFDGFTSTIPRNIDTSTIIINHLHVYIYTFPVWNPRARQSRLRITCS